MEMPPIVEVVWEDAAVLDTGPWTPNEEKAYKPHIVHQVGFLLSATDEGVILTQGWHPECIAARDQIPRGMIRSITPLIPAPEPKKRRR